MNYFKVLLNAFLLFTTMIILTSVGCNETLYNHVYIAENKTSDTLGFMDFGYFNVMVGDSIVYDSGMVFMNKIAPMESKEIYREREGKISIPDAPLPCSLPEDHRTPFNRGVLGDTLFKITNNKPVPVLFYHQITWKVSKFDDMDGQECLGIISKSMIINSDLKN